MQENILITTPKEIIELRLVIDNLSKKVENFEKNFEQKTPTEFLTRNETADLLKVDLSTIHNWTKRKILQSYGCSGRIYYKRSEIENNAIVKLNK